MAIAARKTESQLRYAPRTRVYAQGAACPAAEPVGQPRPKPGHGAARPAGPRVTRIARQSKVNLYVDAGRLLFTTMVVKSSRPASTYRFTLDWRAIRVTRGPAGRAAPWPGLGRGWPTGSAAGQAAPWAYTRVRGAYRSWLSVFLAAIAICILLFYRL